MSENTAAWLVAHAAPFEVKSAPTPEPKDGELVIEAKSIALNPVDWAYQNFGTKFFPHLTYPSIIGIDVAGEVVAVGSSTSKFRVGDRVLGPSQAAFQKYPTLREASTSKIPASLAFPAASIIPLALSTALSGLFHPTYLSLSHPTSPPTPPRNQAILITGGSTSVGSAAIQLAVAAGYTVYTTTSPSHFTHATSLGAKRVFDYASPALASDIRAAFARESHVVGALAIGGIDPADYPAILDACVAALEGGNAPRKFVALTMRPPEKPLPAGFEGKFVQVEGMYDGSGTAEAVWGAYLPKALEAGEFKALPEAVVVGEGLEALQDGVKQFGGKRPWGKLVVTL